MELIKDLIFRNKGVHSSFEYYESIVTIVQQNIELNPDISIESCKALFEGISLSILKRLDNAYRPEIVDTPFPQLFRKAMNVLGEFSEEIEIDFINRACSLIQTLGEIRNKRGDISHGRPAPKEVFSSQKYAKLVVSMSENLLYYILDLYFSIDLSFMEKVKYDDNPEFNQLLDDANPIDTLSYSKALFDQDFISYEEQLADYKSF